MRVLVVGAGAVGVVLFRALEQQKGNECTFLVRKGRKKDLERFKIVDARTGEMRVRERPAAVELGQVRPKVDTVLLCVRADQLGAALDDVGPLTQGTRLATITPGPEGLALLRARHPGHPVVRVAPAFMAYAADSRRRAAPDGANEGSVEEAFIVWFPPLLHSPVSAEDGGPEARAFADELASALDAGGVPARARDRMIRGVDSGTAAMMPLLAAYGLAGFDGDALAQDRALLDLAAEAIADALALHGAPGIAGMIARRAAAPLVRAALVGGAALPARLRAMWRVHGPKIERQTRDAIEQLARRAREDGRPSTALDEILRRMDATG
jgi:ketopantoate reductase